MEWPSPIGDFTGQLTVIAQRRIAQEKLNFHKDQSELENGGIYINWDHEFHKVTAMIVGPEGTPYEYGFYFFEICFPDNYPVHPPQVEFRTGDGRVRFNPNLYINGKVCLSILGTWSGPSWNPLCSLRTVLMSIQSLLNEHPIQNEPGYETELGDIDESYSEIIRYENIAVAVVRMFSHTPEKFKGFRLQMREIFLQRLDNYLCTLDQYEAKDGFSKTSPVWEFPVRYQPRVLKVRLANLMQVLSKDDAAEMLAELEAIDFGGRSYSEGLLQESSKENTAEMLVPVSLTEDQETESVESGYTRSDDHCDEGLFPPLGYANWLVGRVGPEDLI